MASIPPLTNLKVEDFPNLTAASKQETEKLFRALNNALGAIVSALTRGLTFADNMKAAVKTLTVSSAPASFKNTLGAKPAGVFIVSAQDVTTSSSPTAAALGPIAWTTSNDQVVVSSVGGMTAGHSYAITFVILGG